jgi:hypothetical protein
VQDIIIVRSWMAESVRRVAARAVELWQETQAAKEHGDYNRMTDLERWQRVLGNISMQTYAEYLNRYRKGNVAAEYIAIAVHDVAMISALQIRRGLDGEVLEDFVTAAYWAQGYLADGKLALPPDPLVVLRLVDSRLRAVAEELRENELVVPGFEAYLRDAEQRLAEQRDYTVERSGSELIATSTFELDDDDRSTAYRYRVRRAPGSLRFERQANGGERWTDLGAIPLSAAGTLMGLLRTVAASSPEGPP